MPLVLGLLLLAASPFVRVPDKAALNPQPPGPTWVFFTDKGVYNDDDYRAAVSRLERSADPARVQRRLSAPVKGFDFDDLPVRATYIAEIERLGGRLRSVSSWLDAASFDLPPGVADLVYRLPFVYDVRPVAASEEREPAPWPLGRFHSQGSRSVDTAYAHRFYGPSFDQAYLMGVPTIFFKGYYGSGVKLAIFDTGLKLTNLAVARLRITRQHDFISGDNVCCARAADDWTPAAVDNLSRFGLIRDPALETSGSAGDTMVLSFVADSFAYGYSAPGRAIYTTHSTDNGVTWAGAVTIVDSRPYDNTYENLCSATHGTIHYLVWNDLTAYSPSPPVADVYLGWYAGTAWNGAEMVAAGRYPAVMVTADTLYMVLVQSDSQVFFRKASVAQPEPSTLQTTVLSAGESVIWPQVAVLPDGSICVTATGLRSGRVATFRSTDGGLTFTSGSNALSSGASATRLLESGSLLLLLARDESNPAFSRLVLARSRDGGATWLPGVALVDSVAAVGGFTARAGAAGRATLVYEAAGFPACLVTTDTGATWTSTSLADTAGFDYFPAIGGSDDRTAVVWFKRGDDNVAWEDNDTFKFSTEQPDHGTRMASLIAGYQQGAIVGIAPGVDLMLAKTELYKTRSGRYYEYNMEEDAYIEALEWAERYGADVVSTSLGYRGWYASDQFDGKTAPISLAANLAAERGLLVVTAMGNRDTTQYPWAAPYITAPGDAEGVITAGGVEKTLLPWRGTGTGPTSDGRVKPDLVALSDTVAVVSPDSEDYLDGSVGTSCATALIAGCCALVKEAHPGWDAESVRAVLYGSTSRTAKSDTFGYGVPRVDTVYRRYPPEPPVPPIPTDGLGAPFPNPLLPGTQSRVYFPINLSRPAFEAVIRIYSASGTQLDTIELNTDAMTRPGRYGRSGDIATLKRIGAYWDGRDAGGNPVASGLYLAVLQTTFGRGMAKFAVVR